MKVSKILALFLALLILNSTLSTNYIFKATHDHNKLSNYVCKITRDIINSKTDTQDVLIGNLGGKLWSSTVNDIAGCVDGDSAVVVSDFKTQLKEETLRKAAVVVLTFDWLNEDIISSIIQDHHKSTVFHLMTKLIVIVPNTLPSTTRLHSLIIFMEFGFLDVVCVHQIGTDVRFETLASLTRRGVYEVNPSNSLLLFPDKLKNLAGAKYKIVIYHQIPRLLIRGNTIISPLWYFMEAIKKVQNVNVHYNVISNYKFLVDYWLNRDMHLTLNTGFKMTANVPKLLTYEENGYCALVPLPSKTPLFQSILIEPFDRLTWLFFILTMVCCVAVMRLFRNRGAVDSPWLLAYGIVVMFIGQGVNFSRQNRMVLTILLQLIIVMIWILNQAYEGVITSFMIQPIQEHRLETFDDLLASNYKIMTDDLFVLSINESEAYKTLKPRLNASMTKLGGHLHILMKQQSYAFIVKCDQANALINLVLIKGQKVSSLYFVLSQKFWPYLEKLEASYLNPFILRLQYYMDLSFQAGLMHIWRIYASQTKGHGLGVQPAIGASYLKLEDLVQVFSILMVGILLSTSLLIIEVFCHDILVKLKLINLARKLRNRVHQLAYKKRKQPKHPKYQKGALYYIIHRRKRVKRLKARRLKVRRIYVQPRFPMD